MAIKVLVFLASLALVQSSILPSQQLHVPVNVEEASSFANPNYKFEYSVNDPHTGDIKAQHETRQGDFVKGSYSLNEADGTKRIVHYTADGHNGFNAIVERKGHAIHPQNYYNRPTSGHFYQSQISHPQSYRGGYDQFGFGQNGLGTYNFGIPTKNLYSGNGFGYLYNIQHHY